MQLRKILVPIDFSESALAAARAAADLARLSGGTLLLLHVPELTSGIGLDTLIHPARGEAGIPLREYFARKADKDFAALKEELGELISAVRIRPNRKPAVEILAEADEQDVDMIVMGSHGRVGFQRLLMGSVTETVIRQTDRPVLVITGERSPA